MLSIGDLKDQLARLERADSLGKDLGSKIQSWGADLSTQPSISSDRRSWELRLNVPNPPPLGEWALILSDSVHQLRSALDNLVFSVLTPLGGNPKNPRLIKFPIASTLKEWNAIEPYLEHLPAEYLERIKSWQPFAADGRSVEQNGLIWLQRLSNPDKHELQAKPLINTSELNHSFSLEFETVEEAAKSVPPDINVLAPDFQDGAVLMRQNTRGRLHKVRGSYQVKARVEIVINEGSYGITGTLAKVWEFTALTIKYVSDIPDTEWSSWYSNT